MDQIGKFQLKKVLGKGASGTVYLALDTFSGQDVALKVLDPEIVSDPEFSKTRLKQFMNEASLAGQLSHPHIASILGAAVDQDSGGYIALEYVPGGDLSQFTSPESLLAVGDAIEIAFKCCGALDYAFRQGIVHATSSRPLDHHSDMFALGVVLYELFTGSRPFVATSMTELFRKILREDPVVPSALRPGLGEEVDRILLQMLRKVPAERYPGWAELALDLADIGHLSVYQYAIPDHEKFVTLRKIAVLERLSDAEVWELVHAGRWRRVPAHTVIVREGEPGTTLFFLGSGEAKVTKQGRLLNVLHTGEYFGEMAYIKAGTVPRQASAESITDVLLAEFETAALQQVSTNCRLQLTFSLLHTLVDRLSLADERITQAVT